MIKFSTVLGARHNNARKIFSEAARRLKNDGTITSWDILHMGRRGLIMKTWNRRRPSSYSTRPEKLLMSKVERKLEKNKTGLEIYVGIIRWGLQMYAHVTGAE